jgi:ribosome-binding factor A
MKKTKRTNQVGDQIRGEIAQIIQRELRDPDIGFVTITEVEVSTDFSFARVFVSTLKEEERDASIEALQRAAGKIRHMLGKRLRLRNIPELEFRADLTAEHADQINRLLLSVMPPETDERNEDE